jgi:hypothetical protein
MSNKSRIIVQHDKHCFMKDKDVPFSGIPVGTFWGNFAANEKANGRSYLWVKVSCNDPKCKGIKAVDSEILATAK